MKNNYLLGALLGVFMVGNVAIVAHGFFAPEAVAQSSAKSIVDSAIANGLIGETASGYLALVSGSASQSVVNAMNEINIGRKSLYTRLAREQNVAVEIVADLTGEKQIAKATLGSKYMNSQGQWVTK